MRRKKEKSFKDVVRQILDFHWELLSAMELHRLMILSACAAEEFAESLGITLQLYPDNQALQEMAHGELDTDNLTFEDYSRKGNHSDFLWHFIEKYGISDHDAKVHGGSYLHIVRRGITRKTRAMSIFSREHELPEIFKRILQAPDWSTPALQAFRYYLVRHVELDSGDGGHADLLSDFDVNEDVYGFWVARRDMYRCIPTLFGEE